MFVTIRAQTYHFKLEWYQHRKYHIDKATERDYGLYRVHMYDG